MLFWSFETGSINNKTLRLKNMSIQQKLKAAVVGMRMGAEHAKAYNANPRTELAVICDTNKNTLAQLAKVYPQADHVGDYRRILDNREIDIVSVATPDQLHREQCIAFMEAGKHVLCEKPLALTRDDCGAIIEAAKRTDKKCMVGQVCRFAPGFVLAKSLISREVIGDLFMLESEYAHDYLHARGTDNWRTKNRDPVIGGGCHAIDLLRWIGGEIVTVSAYGNHKMLTDWDIAYDSVMAALRFVAGGAIGRLMVSIAVKRPYTMRSVFHGTAGTIIADNVSPTVKVFSTKWPMKLDWMEIPVNIDSHNVGAEVNYFVEVILDGRPFELDAVEGANTVATALAIGESARANGIPMTVELFRRR